MEILINIAEVFIVYYLLSHVLASEEGSRTDQIAGAVGIFLVVSVLNFCKVNVTLTGIVMAIAEIIYANLCFRGSRVEKTLWGCSYILVAAVADRITFRLLAPWYGYNLEQLLSPGVIRYQIAAIYLFICVLLAGLIICIRKRSPYLPLRYQILLVLNAGGGFMALDKLMDLIIVVSRGEYPAHYIKIIDIICLLVTGIIAAMLYVLGSLGQIYQERNQLFEKQKREEFEQKAYENMRDHMKIMNVWKHDYKNQIETIQFLLLRQSYSEAIDYIKKIGCDMEAELSRVNTGNPILDAVISSKMLLAENNGIKFQYQVFTVDQLQLKLTDLASVIGNLLDNAIEACQRMEDSEKTYIFLQITPCEEMMRIRVRNSCDGIYKVEKGKLQSRKQGEGHGLGVARITKIASQEGGFCNYYAERDCFEFVIMMPVK